MTEEKLNISRRTFLAGTAAAAAAFTLPLNRKLMPSASRDDTLSIGLQGVVPSAYASILDTLSGFTKATGITIKPFTITGSTWVAAFAELSTRIAGGEAVDSAYIPTEGMLLFEQKGLLAPLDSYITKDQALVANFLSRT